MTLNRDDVTHHITRYWKVGGALLVLTIVTLAVSYVHVAVPLAVTIALLIAGTKGSLVAGYFMHLIGERKTIFAVLGLVGVLFLALILMPILGHVDQLGEHRTMSNADAARGAALTERHH